MEIAKGGRLVACLPYTIKLHVCGHSAMFIIAFP